MLPHGGLWTLTLPAPTQTAHTLFEVTRTLLRAEARGGAYRLIGAGLSDLAASGEAAADLFGARPEPLLEAEKAMDRLRERFGAGAVTTARGLAPPGVSKPANGG